MTDDRTNEERLSAVGIGGVMSDAVLDAINQKPKACYRCTQRMCHLRRDIMLKMESSKDMLPTWAGSKSNRMQKWRGEMMRLLADVCLGYEEDTKATWGDEMYEGLGARMKLDMDDGPPSTTQKYKQA